MTQTIVSKGKDNGLLNTIVKVRPLRGLQKNLHASASLRVVFFRKTLPVVTSRSFLPMKQPPACRYKNMSK